MEIRRFGPGHRRPEGPPGTQGLTGQVIWSDLGAVVTELAFSRRGLIPPHTNPNTTLFIIISGGGFVQVGDERLAVNHGEAVVWPADVPHGAFTDGTEMRAIIVEVPEQAKDAGILEGRATELEPGPGARPEPARGSLAERPPSREQHDESEGEPW